MKTFLTSIALFPLVLAILRADSEPIGFVEIVRGKATCIRKLKKAKLFPEKDLINKDYVKTGKDGLAWLSLNSSKKITLNASTALTIGKNPIDTKSMEIHLHKGKVRSKVEKLSEKSKFYIKTPLSVVGVRGTDFITAYTQDDQSEYPFELMVLEGQVEIAKQETNENPNPKKVLVNENQRLYMNKDGQMSEPEDISKSLATLEMSKLPLADDIKTAMENDDLDIEDEGVDEENVNQENDDSSGNGSASGHNDDYDDNDNSQGVIIPATFILILLLVGAGGAAFWYMRRSRSKQSQKKKGETRDSSLDQYQSDDVFVIRGNLTIEQSPFKTEKVTHILGDVEDGVTIEAQHKLLIKGIFQGAELTSSSDVAILGGINGHQKAILQTLGSVQTSYTNEAAILAGGKIDIKNSIRNSNIIATGPISVSEKSIMGGVIASAASVSCPELGSDFCETKVVLGMPAAQVWKEHAGFDLKIELPTTDSNTTATLKVLRDIISAKILLGEATLEQKKPVPGPVKSHYDSNELKVILRGFKPNEE